MNERFDWKAYVQDAHDKHVLRYLTYAQAHEQTGVAEYAALEIEQTNILTGMDQAYRNARWEQVRQFMWALDSYLNVRGHWTELRSRLRQAIHAAEVEGHQRDAAGFAANFAALGSSRV